MHRIYGLKHVMWLGALAACCWQQALQVVDCKSNISMRNLENAKFSRAGEDAHPLVL